jgi:hypothetical protein
MPVLPPTCASRALAGGHHGLCGQQPVALDRGRTRGPARGWAGLLAPAARILPVRLACLDQGLQRLDARLDLTWRKVRRGRGRCGRVDHGKRAPQAPRRQRGPRRQRHGSRSTGRRLAPRCQWAVARPQRAGPGGGRCVKLGVRRAGLRSGCPGTRRAGQGRADGHARQHSPATPLEQAGTRRRGQRCEGAGGQAEPRSLRGFLLPDRALDGASCSQLCLRSAGPVEAPIS